MFAALQKISERARHHSRSISKCALQQLVSTEPSQKRMVFVTGQQRSGTNMLMDVLERHRCTDVYHETDSRAFVRYEMRDLATIRAIFSRSRASHIVIKALCEAQRLTELLDAFPKAKAIWAVRNHYDVSVSMSRQFSTTAEVLKQMRVDPALGGWRGENLSPSIRALLDDCVQDDISEVSAAAFQWYMRNFLYFDQGLDRDPRVRICFYEDLATAPEPTCRSIAAFLGISFQHSMITKVHAGSVNKAGHPEIDPRIEALCSHLLGRLADCAQKQP